MTPFCDATGASIGSTWTLNIFTRLPPAIKSGFESPPKAPGTATEELLYHFGPYAPAAAISRLDGLDLGDALPA